MCLKLGRNFSVMQYKDPNLPIARAILEHLSGWEKPGKKFILGLDGPSGVGKSSIARTIKRLRGQVTVLSLDQFKATRDIQVKLLEEGDLSGIKDWYDLDGLQKTISSFWKEDKFFVTRKFRHLSGEKRTARYFLKSKILIVDGIFISHPDLRVLCNKIVFLERDNKYVAVRRAKRAQRINEKYGTHLSLRSKIHRQFDSLWKKYALDYQPETKADVWLRMVLPK